MKNALLALVNFALFVFFVIKSTPVWIAFLSLSIFYLYKCFQKKTIRVSEVAKPSKKIEYDVFGGWVVDSGSEGESFGVYIELNGSPVFIDIREDSLLSDRKLFAVGLIQNKLVLENNLNIFMKRHPKYIALSLNSIGLHSDNIDQGEVFWDPDGYTILRGLEFYEK